MRYLQGFAFDRKNQNIATSYRICNAKLSTFGVQQKEKVHRKLVERGDIQLNAHLTITRRAKTSVSAIIAKCRKVSVRAFIQLRRRGQNLNNQVGYKS